VGYAEVSVNSPVAQRRTFSYSIPPDLTVQVGQAVWVPFGDKTLQGIVLELTDSPAVEETRDIAGIIDPHPILSPPQISLARWISGHYLSPLFDAVALMLPPGFERRAVTYIYSPLSTQERDTSSLTPEQRAVIETVWQQKEVALAEIEKRLGIKKAKQLTTQLIGQGWLARSYQLEPVRVKPKQVPYLRLTVPAGAARKQAEELRQKRAAKQAALLEVLADKAEPMPWAKARNRAGCAKAAADALVAKGLAGWQQVEVKRRPITHQEAAPSPPLKITAAQKSALKAITDSMDKPAVFLLHGVTGSGKTEVYMQALAETVRRGRRGIVLVPEIALTPQTIDRFASRFPGRVAVLHSRLSLGERFDEWQRIRDEECDVVIGPRSAVFAPQPDLGLIVIDEEHEWTYKQSDKSPRYHARDAALKLAELAGATIVLGSATPDVESYYHAQRGDYQLLRLPERVVPKEGSPLPQVEVVDLRDELKARNFSIFSRSLSRAITDALANKEQVILFLNRRGGATFVQCRDCGFVLRCRRCDVALTYHFTEDALRCHQCNYRMPVPQSCPQCHSRRIKFLGIGTQKLEQETARAFPQARLLRWDSDTTTGRHSHQEILDRFRSHDADILIGTQMVAKGLDLPLVTVVGVVSADTSLNLPDFRAGERTFQLLSQVAGRAGRGGPKGEVIIQSYSPEHYAIKLAAGHDYATFYDKEIGYRRQLQNPPLSRLARLMFSHSNDAHSQHEAQRIKRLLNEEIASKGIDDITVIGPAPAFVPRLRGRFRWQLILRGAEPAVFLAQIAFPQGWTADIDPMGLA